MSTTNILDLNNRIDALEKAVSGGDSAQANKKDIATEFNTTTAYTAGCFVYYKGKLYQFNADHAAGAWDPTDVVEANVTDQIVSNKAAIDGLTASDIAYNNTVSGLSATDVQGAVDETNIGLTRLHFRKVAESEATGTEGQKLSSLYATYTTISAELRKNAVVMKNNHDMYLPINMGGVFGTTYVDSNTVLLSTIKLNEGTAFNNVNGTTSEITNNTTQHVYSLWVKD